MKWFTKITALMLGLIFIGSTAFSADNQELKDSKWHLIHAGVVNNTELTGLIKDSNIISIWGWSTTQSNWLAIFQNEPEGNPFGKLEDLKEGSGYWVNVSADANVPISTSSTEIGYTHVESGDGWVLVGTREAIEIQTTVSHLADFEINTEDMTSTGGAVWVWEEGWKVYFKGVSSINDVPEFYKEGEEMLPGLSLLTSSHQIPANSGFWISAGGSGLMPPIVGQVSVLPDEIEEGKTEITNADMKPTKAVVSLYLLSDTEFENPIVTVKTDKDGNYSVKMEGKTLEDLRNFLVASDKTKADGTAITETSSAEDVENALKNLGQLQIRALVVKKVKEKQEDGTYKEVSKAQAIQTIADPNSKEPVKVNPVVHKLMKTIMDSVKEALKPLKTLSENGVMTEAQVKTLIDGVLTNVATTITTALEQVDTSKIEIPEGQNLEDVVAKQDDDMVVDLDDDVVKDLEENVLADENLEEDIASTTSTGTDTGTTTSFDTTKLKVKETKSDEMRNTSAGLSDEMGGLVAKMKNDLNESVVQNAGDNLDATEKLKIQKESIQEFLISLGFAVVLEKDDDSETSAVGFFQPSPPHIDGAYIPGERTFGNREVRHIKIGDGTLETYNPEKTLEEQFEAFKEDSGLSTPEAFKEFMESATKPWQFEVLDRVFIFHEFANELKNSPLVSDEIIDQIVANSDKGIKIKNIAAVISDNFKWVQQQVNVTPEGLPIFGKEGAPKTGEKVDASELINKLSFTVSKDPINTANKLVQNPSFFAQFSGDLIQTQLERRSAEKAEFNLGDEVNEIYSEISEAENFEKLSKDKKEDLIKFYSQSPAFEGAKEDIVQGVIAAIPDKLAGQRLTSESEVKIKTALFFLNYLLANKYAVSTDEGFFLEGKPNFKNFKQLSMKGSSSVAKIVTSLLSLKNIEEGAAFTAAKAAVKNLRGDGGLLENLFELPEFKERSAEEFANEFIGDENKVSSVSVSCTVERFDGGDPKKEDSDENSAENLIMKVFKVEYDEETHEPYIADSVGDMTAGELLTTDGPKRRTYSMSFPIDTSFQPSDYVAKMKIESYQNDLPEMYFFVDGFVDNIVVCDPNFPMVIPPDEDFSAPVPGIGLGLNQVRPNPDGSESPEGADLSNFENPGMPFILSEKDEAGEKIPGIGEDECKMMGGTYNSEDDVCLKSMGKIDFRFVTTDDGGSQLVTSGNGAFAQLFNGTPTDTGEIPVVLTSNDDPKVNLESLFGSDLRTLLSSLSELTGQVIPIDPENFRHNQLWLFRDRDNEYWVLELRFVEFFVNPDGHTDGFIDIGFVKVRKDGKVQVPEAGFENMVNDKAMNAGFRSVNLFFGDGFVLERGDYTGPEIIPPEPPEGEFDFMPPDADRTKIQITYSGNYYEELKAMNKLGEVLGTENSPPDFSSVPVQLEAFSDSIRMAKLNYREQSKDYLISSEFRKTTGDLKDGDIVAVYWKPADDATPVTVAPKYILRIIKERQVNTPEANMDLSFDIIPYNDENEKAIVKIITSSEIKADEELDKLPRLYSSADLETVKGIVFDKDKDGVPGLFDPNDEDPYVVSGGGFDAGVEGEGSMAGGVGAGVGLFFMSEPKFDKDGNPKLDEDGEQEFKKFLNLEVFGLPTGEIKYFKLRHKSEGDDTQNLFGQNEFVKIFGCTPASKKEGVFTEVSCKAESVDGFTISEIYTEPSGTGFKILPKASNAFTEILIPGSRHKFAYSIKFSKPKELDGTTMKCGDKDCDAMADFNGDIVFHIPKENEVLGAIYDVTLEEAGEDRVDLEDGIKINAGREIKINAAAVSNASEYEMGIVCEGKEDVNSFLDRFEFFLHSPAFDNEGRNQPMTFMIPPGTIPGGRTCNIELNAHGVNEAGIFIGTTHVEFHNIITTGGSGEVGDNMLKLTTGDVVCFSPEVIANSDSNIAPMPAKVTVNNTCGSDETLFTVASLTPGDGDQEPVAHLTGLASKPNVGTPIIALAEGNVKKDASIFVNDLDSPACGRITGDKDIQPFECDDASHEILRREDGKIVMGAADVLTGATFKIPTPEGPQSLGQTEIKDPGHYFIHDQDDKQLYEFDVQIFQEPSPDGASTNEMETMVWIWLGTMQEQKGQQASKDAMDVSPGRWFNVQLSEHNQPVDFDVRFIGDSPTESGTVTVVRMAWFLPPPMIDISTAEQVVDFNGDGQKEITITPPDGDQKYKITVETHVENAEMDKNGIFTNLRDIGSKNDNGTITFPIPSAMNHLELVIIVDGMRYRLVLDLNENRLEWWPEGDAGASDDGGMALFENEPFIGNDTIGFDPNNMDFYIQGTDGFNEYPEEKVLSIGQLPAATATITVGEKWTLKDENNDEVSSKEISLSGTSDEPYKGFFHLSTWFTPNNTFCDPENAQDECFPFEVDLVIEPMIFDSKIEQVFAFIMPPMGTGGSEGPGGFEPMDQNWELQEGKSTIIYDNEFKLVEGEQEGVMKVVVTKSTVTLTAMGDKLRLEGPNVMDKVAKISRDGSDMVYQFISENPDIPNKDVGIFADKNFVELRLMEPFKFFAEELYEQDGVRFEEKSDPEGNTWLEARLVRMADADGNDEPDADDVAVMVVGTNSNWVVKPFNDWTIKSFSDDIATDLKAPDGIGFANGILSKGDKEFFIDVDFMDGSVFINLNPGGFEPDPNQAPGYPIEPVDPDRMINGNFEYQVNGDKLNFHVDLNGLKAIDKLSKLEIRNEATDVVIVTLVGGNSNITGFNRESIEHAHIGGEIGLNDEQQNAFWSAFEVSESATEPDGAKVVVLKKTLTGVEDLAVAYIGAPQAGEQFIHLDNTQEGRMEMGEFKFKIEPNDEGGDVLKFEIIVHELAEGIKLTGADLQNKFGEYLATLIDDPDAFGIDGKMAKAEGAVVLTEMLDMGQVTIVVTCDDTTIADGILLRGGMGGGEPGEGQGEEGENIVPLKPVLDENDEPIIQDLNGEMRLDLDMEMVNPTFKYEFFVSGLPGDKVLGDVIIHTKDAIGSDYDADAPVIVFDTEWKDDPEGKYTYGELELDQSMLDIINDPLNRLYLMVHLEDTTGVLARDLGYLHGELNPENNLVKFDGSFHIIPQWDIDPMNMKEVAVYQDGIQLLSGWSVQRAPGDKKREQIKNNSGQNGLWHLIAPQASGKGYVADLVLEFEEDMPNVRVVMFPPSGDIAGHVAIVALTSDEVSRQMNDDLPLGSAFINLLQNDHVGISVGLQDLDFVDVEKMRIYQKTDTNAIGPIALNLDAFVEFAMGPELIIPEPIMYNPDKFDPAAGLILALEDMNGDIIISGEIIFGHSSFEPLDWELPNTEVETGGETGTATGTEPGPTDTGTGVGPIETGTEWETGTDTGTEVGGKAYIYSSVEPVDLSPVLDPWGTPTTITPDASGDDYSPHIEAVKTEGAWGIVVAFNDIPVGYMSDFGVLKFKIKTEDYTKIKVKIPEKEIEKDLSIGVDLGNGWREMTFPLDEFGIFVDTATQVAIFQHTEVPGKMLITDVFFAGEPTEPEQPTDDWDANADGKVYLYASTETVELTPGNYDTWESGSVIVPDAMGDTVNNPHIKVTKAVEGWGTLVAMTGLPAGFMASYGELKFKIKTPDFTKIKVKLPGATKEEIEKDLTDGDNLGDGWKEMTFPLSEFGSVASTVELAIFHHYADPGTFLITDVYFTGESSEPEPPAEVDDPTVEAPDPGDLSDAVVLYSDAAVADANITSYFASWSARAKYDEILIGDNNVLRYIPTQVTDNDSVVGIELEPIDVSGKTKVHFDLYAVGDVDLLKFKFVSPNNGEDAGWASMAETIVNQKDSWISIEFTLADIPSAGGAGVADWSELIQIVIINYGPASTVDEPTAYFLDNIYFY